MGNGDIPDQNDRDKPPSWRRIIADFVDAYANAQRAKTEKKQRDWPTIWMAGATVFIAIFTAATIGVGIAQWCIQRGTLDEMRAEQRPWVELTEVDATSPLTFGPTGAVLGLKFKLKNVGHTPGFKVVVNFDPMLRSSQDGRDVMNQQAHICPKNGEVPSYPYQGITLFPDGLHDQNGWVRFTPDMVKLWSNQVLLGQASPMLYGCVDYVFSNNEHHQSGFIFEIDRETADQGSQTGRFLTIDPAKGDVPQADIRFAENPALIAPTN